VVAGGMKDSDCRCMGVCGLASTTTPPAEFKPDKTDDWKRAPPTDGGGAPEPAEALIGV